MRTTAAPRICPGAGCMRVVPAGTRCPAHPAPPKRRTEEGQARARDRDRERGSASERGYDRAWSRLRRAHLAAEPLCRHCKKKGRVTPAAEVDHVVPLRQGGARLDDSNLQSLCRRCHAAKTDDDGAAQRRRALAEACAPGW